MFVIIVFVFVGICVGYLFRRRNAAAVSKVVTPLVWILLFLMGVEVGGNERVMQSLPTLGVEALLIALFALTGSCVAAWILWKWIGRKGGGQG